MELSSTWLLSKGFNRYPHSFAFSFPTAYLSALPVGFTSKDTRVYKYKVFGTLKNCPPALLTDVYMDLDYRKQWDQNVEELYERECNGQTVVYWQVKCPMLKSNRDYVYVRERRDLDVEGRKVFVVLAQSISHSQFPERSGVVRVTQCEHRLAITSDGRNGSKVFMYYFDNLRVQIPTWLLKRALKNGVPEFLNNLEKACRNYPRRY
ncbi:phosphatidylcholine transfer protein isoform X2 [Equus przewalskii]|uniref:Phosphatidylcholine transfer protein isoform X2 n=1 Tax=Equus przewalskii TaxID=9798 RepID=A0ABM4JLQ2_EQUPR